MKTQLYAANAVVALGLLAGAAAEVEAKHQWNNPQNKANYERALRQSQVMHERAARAYVDYDGKLARAQREVRDMRNQAIKGAIKGSAAGPGGAAAGAAWGATRSASKSIYHRAKDYRGK